MASNTSQKPGVTTFGWLVLGATAATVLASSSRRDRLRVGLRNFLNMAASDRPATSDPAA